MPTLGSGKSCTLTCSGRPAGCQSTPPPAKLPRTDGLDVLDQDWEQSLFVEKCPGCFAAVVAQN